MFLEELSRDSAVFVDTNILLYDISGHPLYSESSTEFLEKIKGGEMKGVASLIVLNELLHKLILGEIAEEHELKLSQAINFIKQNPEVLRELKAYEVLDEVEDASNLSILKPTLQDFTLARKLMKKYFLLSNDALHLAVMKQNNLNNLASNDSDFERVPWINLYKPSPS